VVSLAHALGLRAVAEGVEMVEQLAELKTLGCELAQGYLFGKPEPAEFWGDRPNAQFAARLRAADPAAWLVVGGAGHRRVRHKPAPSAS
jgi:EAL domain-containing protein (putative c-di-GMP-specific phosphodiesterase class I)